MNWLALVIATTEATQSLGLALVAFAAVVAQTAPVGAWAQNSDFAIAVDAGYALGAGAVMILAHVIF